MIILVQSFNSKIDGGSLCNNIPNKAILYAIFDMKELYRQQFLCILSCGQNSVVIKWIFWTK